LLATIFAAMAKIANLQLNLPIQLISILICVRRMDPKNWF
jgi:hypothetical protein